MPIGVHWLYLTEYPTLHSNNHKNWRSSSQGKLIAPPLDTQNLLIYYHSNFSCTTLKTQIKTRAKVVHKNVGQGYDKVKRHIMKIFLFIMLAFTFSIKISKKSRNLFTISKKFTFNDLWGYTSFNAICVFIMLALTKIFIEICKKSQNFHKIKKSYLKWPLRSNFIIWKICVLIM